MPDRRRRTALHLPPPFGLVLLPRERQSSSTGPSGSPEPSGSQDSSGPSDSPGASGSSDSPGSSGSPSGSAPGAPDDNPFAPPPENRPDQPWRPRRPENGSPDEGAGPGRGRPGWGGQWSSRQPGRSSSGFGSRPGRQGQQNPERGNGQDGPEGNRGGGPRWDPTDPIQRRARYALLAGMWAFFFALFDIPEVALLLGALALYWAVSALRNKPRQPSDNSGARAGGPAVSSSVPARTAPRSPATAGAAQLPNRQQTTAAVSGLVTAALALTIVAATFTVQLVYRDYYTCVNDALTKTGQLSCNDELPHSLVPVFGIKE